MRYIDYVVPMVFHGDKQWQADFLKTDRRYNENDLFDFVRWRSWGLEELLIRCVMRFMPWVRRIYILLAKESQVQEWMTSLKSEGTTAPEVKVVFHREFMPEWALPTFNSCAIEMFLHRIPGLSDRFIYGNDDMFPLTPLREEDFFDGDTPKQHCGFVPMPEKPNIFHLLCLSGLNFVAKEFGKKYHDCLLKCGHGLTPILRETCEYLWKRGGNEIEASVSAFREGKNFSQWIYPWWHYLAGDYVDGGVPCKYINTGSTVDQMVEAIRNGVGVVCVNDNECEKDYMKYGSAVKRAIEERLNDLTKK